MQQRMLEASPTGQPRLAYRDRPGTGRTVLLLHGVGSSSQTWDELERHLPTDARLIAPDYRGHGASDAPEPPYVLQDFVDDAVRLLDGLGIPAVDVVGFSIGALFAEAIALRHPERVHSLVLLNSIGDRTAEERERAALRLASIRTTPPGAGLDASARRWFTDGFRERRPDLVDAELAIVGATPHRPYAASYAVLVQNDLIGELSAIRVPTLVATGQHDIGSTPRMSESIHRRIPSSRLVVVHDVRHYMHIEAAAEVGDLVTDFLTALPRHHNEPPKETTNNANS